MNSWLALFLLYCQYFLCEFFRFAFIISYLFDLIFVFWSLFTFLFSRTSCSLLFLCIFWFCFYWRASTLCFNKFLIPSLISCKLSLIYSNFAFLAVSCASCLSHLSEKLSTDFWTCTEVFFHSVNKPRQHSSLSSITFCIDFCTIPLISSIYRIWSSWLSYWVCKDPNLFLKFCL